MNPICPKPEDEVSAPLDLPEAEKPKVDAVAEPAQQSACKCVSCSALAEFQHRILEAKAFGHDVRDGFDRFKKKMEPFYPTILTGLMALCIMLLAISAVVLIFRLEIGRVGVEIAKIKDSLAKAEIANSIDANAKKQKVAQNSITHPQIIAWFDVMKLNADGNQQLNMYYTGSQKKVAATASCWSSIGPSYTWECYAGDKSGRKIKTDYNVVCAKDQNGKIVKERCVFNYFSLDDQPLPCTSWWGC
jgi:hypothetical protein